MLVIDSLGSGGAQNQLTLLALALKSRGHNVVVFLYYDKPFFKPRLEQGNITCVLSKKTNKIGLGVVQNLVGLVNKNKFDGIISFLDTPNFYSCLALVFSKHKPKLIISYRSKTDFTNMSWFTKKRKEWVNNRADHIVTNSHHERKRWQQSYPNQAEKWKTIYNVVDTKKFKPNTFSKRSESFLVVGSVGPAKNGLLLIEALNELKKREIIVYITWVGQKAKDIKERRDYIELMESKISEYGLSNQWAWQEPTHTIQKEYSSYKALILASLTEGLPNVVCEALCSGLPCIISNVLDHPNLIKNNESGFLFDPMSSRELCEAIISIISLPERNYAEMQLRVREKGLKLFNQSSFLEYEKLLSCSC